MEVDYMEIIDRIMCIVGYLVVASCTVYGVTRLEIFLVTSWVNDNKLLHEVYDAINIVRERNNKDGNPK